MFVQGDIPLKENMNNNNFQALIRTLRAIPDAGSAVASGTGAVHPHCPQSAYTAPSTRDLAAGQKIRERR